MVLPDWVTEYSAVAAATFFGSFANGPRWRDSSGNFCLSQFLTEGATVLGLTVGLIGLADYSHGIIDLKVLCGGGVLFGWLGPKPIADFVLTRLGVRK